MDKKSMKQHMMELFFRRDFIDANDKWGIIKKGLKKDFQTAITFTLCSVLGLFLAILFHSF